MSEVVLDASAVLALINEEPGGEAVDALLDDAIISAVNWSEVIAVLIDAGFAVERAGARIEALDLQVVAFDRRRHWLPARCVQRPGAPGCRLGIGRV